MFIVCGIVGRLFGWGLDMLKVFLLCWGFEVCWLIKVFFVGCGICREGYMFRVVVVVLVVLLVLLGFLVWFVVVWVSILKLFILIWLCVVWVMFIVVFLRKVWVFELVIFMVVGGVGCLLWCEFGDIDLVFCFCLWLGEVVILLRLVCCCLIFIVVVIMGICRMV